MQNRDRQPPSDRPGGPATTLGLAPISAGAGAKGHRWHDWALDEATDPALTTTSTTTSTATPITASRPLTGLLVRRNICTGE